MLCTIGIIHSVFIPIGLLLDALHAGFETWNHLCIDIEERNLHDLDRPRIIPTTSVAKPFVRVEGNCWLYIQSGSIFTGFHI